MGPRIIEVDNKDKLPPQSPGRVAGPWSSPPHAPRRDWRSVAVLCAASLIAIPLLYWLLHDYLYDWITYGDGTLYLSVVRWGALAAAGIYLLRRGLIIEQAGGIKLFGWQVAQAHGDTILPAIVEVQRGYATTPFRDTAAYTYTQQIPTKMLEAQVIDQSPADPGLSLIPDSDWLRWVDRAPHLLLAGKTDAGKTTMASALLADRILAGDDVLILDPHHQPGKWFGLDAVSGIPAILDTLPSLIDELAARYEEYKAGRLTEDFDRLTILIDEVPAIVDHCIDMTASGRPKVTNWAWHRFARKLGSEARKVRISVMLLSQSTLVQDLMINVQMKENFTRIGIGDQARPLLAEEPQSKRRQQLFDLLRGQAHPAAMEYRGDYYLLDTAQIPALAERSVRSLARPWAIPEINPTRSIAAPLSGLSVALRAHVKSGENGHLQNNRQTDRQTEWDHAKKVAVLRAMRQAGITRNAARDRLAGIGQGFDNDDWTEAGM